MPVYEYVGHNTNTDTIVRESFTTDTRDQLLEHLKKLHIDLIDVRVVSSGFQRRSRIPNDDLLDFFRSLRATRFGSVSTGISSYLDICRNKPFRELLAKVQFHLLDGEDFATALSHYEVFDRWLVAILRSSLDAADLDGGLEQVCNILRRRQRTRRAFSEKWHDIVQGVRWIGALLAFYAYWLGPRLAGSVGGRFGRYKAEESFLTKGMLLFVSVTHSWIFILAVVAATALWFTQPYIMRLHPALERWREKLILDWTGEYGRIRMTEYSAHIGEQLAMLLPSFGKSLVLSMIAEGLPFKLLRDDFETSIQLVDRGQPLHAALDQVERLDSRLKNTIYTTRDLPLKPPGKGEETQVDKGKEALTVVGALGETTENLFEEVDDRSTRFIATAGLRIRLSMIAFFGSVSALFAGPYFDTILSSLQFHAR